MAVNLNALRIRWRMATRYGYHWDLLNQALLGSVRRFLVCRVLGDHQEKFSSHGRCYKCGKALR